MKYSMQTIQNDTMADENDAEQIVTISVRVPDALWIAVKRTALDRRTTAQQLTIDALTAHLKQKGIRAA
jgi:hypothetical protein